MAGVDGDVDYGREHERVDTGVDTTDVDSLPLAEARVNVDRPRVETGQVRLRNDIVRKTETVREDVACEELEVDGNR